MKKPDTPYLQRILGFPSEITKKPITTKQSRLDNARSAAADNIYQDDVAKVARLPSTFHFADVYKFSTESAAPNQYTASLIKRFIKNGLVRELLTPNSAPLSKRIYEKITPHNENYNHDEFILGLLDFLPEQFREKEIAHILEKHGYYDPAKSASAILKVWMKEERLIRIDISIRVIEYKKVTK